MLPLTVITVREGAGLREKINLVQNVWRLGNGRISKGTDRSSRHLKIQVLSFSTGGSQAIGGEFLKKRAQSTLSQHMFVVLN